MPENLARVEIMVKTFSSFVSLSMLVASLHATSHGSHQPYVVGALIGQLGNQMFEVATTYALAWDHDAQPYFPDFAPVAGYEHGYYKHFFFRCPISPPSREISYEWGAPPYGYVPIPFHPGMRLSGYFQNEQYFAHHRNRLLELFAPHPDDLRYIQNKYRRILSHPHTVSVHLRYYYAEKPDEDSFIQYDWEYFDKAMALFPASALFVVTSDNLEFARKNISTAGRNVIFIEGEHYYIDFLLQSMCKHNIICNSTFSWWSAWLNQNPNKIVVRPAVWMEGYPDIGGPEEWIKVDAQGMQARLRNAN